MKIVYNSIYKCVIVFIVISSLGLIDLLTVFDIKLCWYLVESWQKHPEKGNEFVKNISEIIIRVKFSINSIEIR